jgi:hypothetical protein
MKSTNHLTLQTIESALFTLSLDYNNATDAQTNSNVFLHAARNRWYDKSLQLIVSRNGRAAINFEHSWGDGVCVLRLCNEIVEHSMAESLAAVSGGGASAKAVRDGFGVCVCVSLLALTILRSQLPVFMVMSFLNVCVCVCVCVCV